jgi:uncharacterized phiE125 gp8 family phage protein
MFKVITAVTAEPVLLATARLHLKADSTTEDALIEAWITAAREFAEHYTGRSLAAQVLEMALDEFPADGAAIELDMPPVNAITSVKYTDTAGVEQTLDVGSYALSTYGASRTLALTYGSSWPSTREVPDAVRIRYSAGYAICPKAAIAAILLMVAHWYEHRSDVHVGSTVSEMPIASRSLLDTIRIWAK